MPEDGILVLSSLLTQHKSMSDQLAALIEYQEATGNKLLTITADLKRTLEMWGAMLATAHHIFTAATQQEMGTLIYIDPEN